MEWILRQRFRAMLVALVLLLVVFPVLEEYQVTRIAFDVLRSVVFLIALAIIFKARRLRSLAVVMAVPITVGTWAYSLRSASMPPGIDAAFNLTAAIFLGIAIIAILTKVYADEDVSIDSICGAFCGYLLVGVIFGHLFGVAEVLQPDSFRMSDEALAQFRIDDRTRYLLTYYSMITLTTVGYGDIVPATAVTRGLAMIEAVAGQFYIAVLVAELIGKRVSQAVSNRPSQDQNS